MTTYDDNALSTRVDNSTIYHTGDAVALLRRTIAHTEADADTYWRGLDAEDVKLFKVIYPSYNGERASANWQKHCDGLYLSLPRQSRLKAKASPLTSLAGASDGVDEDSDENYVLYAGTALIRSACDSMAEALNRGGDIDISGLRLRYCNRLTQKQKRAQRLHILSLELEYLRAERGRIERLADDLELSYVREIEKAKADIALALAGSK